MRQGGVQSESAGECFNSESRSTLRARFFLSNNCLAERPFTFRLLFKVWRRLKLEVVSALIGSFDNFEWNALSVLLLFLPLIECPPWWFTWKPSSIADGSRPY